MTTDTRSALEIAVAFVKKMQLHVAASVGPQADEALAAMRAAPGLADDTILYSIACVAIEKERNNPSGGRNAQVAMEMLKAIDAYQREKAGR